MEQLPNRIREMRKARNLKLEDLATRVGCSTTYLSDMERGLRDLGYEWMKRIARALKVQPADLFAEKDNSRSLSAGQRELIDLFEAADEPQREQLLQMARIVVAPKKRAA